MSHVYDINELSVYLSILLKILVQCFPEMMATRPVFGCSLEEHLRHSKRDVASVIEECAVTIIRKGLDVEVC